MSVRLRRLEQHPTGTLGQMTLSLPAAPVLWTLENTGKIIPPGIYPIALRWSNRFQMLLPGLDVPDRTDIEIHPANRWDQLLGCIAPGMYRVSQDEVGDSRIALGRFLTIWKSWESTTLEITEEFSALGEVP